MVEIDPAAPCVPGAAARLSERVTRITAPNPGVMTGPGTNTYLVGDGEVAVIDPGPADPVHLDRLAQVGAGRIRWILATHTHPDHAPGAAGLRDRTEAEVLAFASRDGLVADRLLGDGDVVAGDGFRLTATHTPGHASNHLCYVLDDGWVFSGDHIMQGSTVVITPPDGDMAAYLDSLRRLRALDLTAVAPGHGTVIDDPAAIIDYYVTHRLAREASITEALGRLGSATVDQVVAAVYTDVPEVLHPVARHSVFAHLIKLMAEGQARGGPGIDDLWHPVHS